MKVDNLSNKLPGAITSKPRSVGEELDGSQSKTNQDQNIDPKKSIKVNISEQAQMFQKAKAIANKEEVNGDKIARLQALIDSGNYKVDAKAIADKLVDEHLEAES